MVGPLFQQVLQTTCRWGIPAVACLLLSPWAPRASAQSQVMHQLTYPNRLPGTTVPPQFRARPDIAGYFQPVRVVAPSECQVSVAADGVLPEPAASQVLAGLQVGPVYRLAVSYVDRGQSAKLYPTLEVLGRLYPPEGESERFPLIVEITDDDLQQAAAGNLITKVIYLEDPRQAIAQVDRPDEQRWFDTRPQEDPLKMADDLGKPMAILRIGSRTPGDAGPDNEFLFGSPPLTVLAEPVVSASYPAEVPSASGIVPQRSISRAYHQGPAQYAPAVPATRGAFLQIRD